MGSFVIYIIEWALCLSAFLLLYKMCFSGSTFHRFNRLFLLVSVIVSALLPLIHITANEQMEPIAEVCRLNTEELSPLPAVGQLQMQMTEAPVELTTGQKILIAFAFTYLIYIAIQLVGWLRSLAKMLLFLRGKRSRRVGRWICLVVHGEEYGPFSWMNYIVISNKENGFSRRASMHHELSHIKLQHPLDLVFILLCTLINPVCWLVMKEIKVVHEYEADDEVINHYHIQSRDYQRLLIMRTVGAEAYALACSFNLNIKKRIIMMKKKQSTWWRITWIAVTIPLVGIALTAFSKPKEVLKEMVDNSVTTIQKTTLINEVGQATEHEVPETTTPVTVEVKAEKDVKPGDQITYNVKDVNGQPLSGANIFETDEFGRIVAHAVTDKEGNFSLKVVDPKHKIRISYIGMKSLTLDISSKKLEVKLEPNTNMSDIQVVARRDSIVVPQHKDEPDNNQDGDELFDVIEQMPSFPGGQGELMKYLSSHLRYPAVAREMGVEARVLVRFTIDKAGVIRTPQVESTKAQPVTTSGKADEEAEASSKYYDDAVEALKEEAIYVVRNMPRWEPGRQNGKHVETTYTLPINFKLTKND